MRGGGSVLPPSVPASVTVSVNVCVPTADGIVCCVCDCLNIFGLFSVSLRGFTSNLKFGHFFLH